jgi:hypothetical protein
MIDDVSFEKLMPTRPYDQLEQQPAAPRMVFCHHSQTHDGLIRSILFFSTFFAMN